VFRFFSSSFLFFLSPHFQFTCFEVHAVLAIRSTLPQVIIHKRQFAFPPSPFPFLGVLHPPPLQKYLLFCVRNTPPHNFPKYPFFVGSDPRWEWFSYLFLQVFSPQFISIPATIVDLSGWITRIASAMQSSPPFHTLQPRPLSPSSPGVNPGEKLYGVSWNLARCYSLFSPFPSPPQHNSGLVFLSPFLN